MLTIQPPLPSVLFYALDEAKLNAEQQATLEQHANFLAVHPDYTIQIHGHADNQGKAGYNQRLSLTRARLVADRLTAAGVKRQQIEIFGWSSDDPILSPSQHDKNRRVELIYLNSQLAFSYAGAPVQDLMEKPDKQDEQIIGETEIMAIE